MLTPNNAADNPVFHRRERQRLGGVVGFVDAHEQLRQRLRDVLWWKQGKGIIGQLNVYVFYVPLPSRILVFSTPLRAA